MHTFYDGKFRVFRKLCGSDNNNAYLIVCPQTRESIIVDAPLAPEDLLNEARATRVQAILITHKHRDHLEGLQEITQATGAPVGAHGEDAADMPLPPNFLVNEGDTIRAGTIEMKVIHTPGHTPGSVCYLAGRYLFSGDTLFAGGIGKTQSLEELEQAYSSVTEKLYVLPDNTLVLPGHFHATTIGVEKEAYQVFAAQYPDILPPIGGWSTRRT